MAHAEFKVGELTAIIGDNAAHDQHRAGYNGVWSLIHSAGGERSIFVPQIAGLNLEHIINGQEPLDREIFFEPRNAPMSFTRISGSEAELHQPPTPTFHVESWTRFRLTPPHYLDMSFRCRPHQHLFPRGYLALFWASYMNAPEDKSMYFRGGPASQTEPYWTQLCTQLHNRDSTVRHRTDSLDLTFAPGEDALYKNLSPLRFDEPFFYGNIENLTWILMFERSQGIRFTHSPSGGGLNVGPKTANPAWDFQFLIRSPEVGEEYRFKMRTALRARCTREQIVEEYHRWRDQA